VTLADFVKNWVLRLASVRGLGSFVAALLRGRVVVVLYPGVLNPVTRSFLGLLYKLLYLFVYQFLLLCLGGGLFCMCTTYL
jgi:hypothetical protein